MPWLIGIGALITSIASKAFDLSKDVVLKFFDFISINGRLLIKWGFFLVIINLTFTLLSFFLYTIYYGGAYVLSQFCTQTTLNIIHLGFLGVIIYFIYKFLYKD